MMVDESVTIIYRSSLTVLVLIERISNEVGVVGFTISLDVVGELSIASIVKVNVTAHPCTRVVEGWSYCLAWFHLELLRGEI